MNDGLKVSQSKCCQHSMTLRNSTFQSDSLNVSIKTTHDPMHDLAHKKTATKGIKKNETNVLSIRVDGIDVIHACDGRHWLQYPFIIKWNKLPETDIE